MWKNLKIENVGAIERCVAEFQIWAHNILPYGKMKIKIYESQEGKFFGYTDIRIIRKFDDNPEGAVGHGKTIEEALTDTVNQFMQIANDDFPAYEYPNGLPEEKVVYSDYSDF